MHLQADSKDVWSQSVPMKRHLATGRALKMCCSMQAWKKKGQTTETHTGKFTKRREQKLQDKRVSRIKLAWETQGGLKLTDSPEKKKKVEVRQLLQVESGSLPRYHIQGICVDIVVLNNKQQNKWKNKNKKHNTKAINHEQNIGGEKYNKNSLLLEIQPIGLQLF